MAVFTKSEKNDLAYTMANKKFECELNELKSKLTDELKSFLKIHTPTNVQKCFVEHPKYFNSTNSVYFNLYSCKELFEKRTKLKWNGNLSFCIKFDKPIPLATNSTNFSVGSSDSIFQSCEICEMVRNVFYLLSEIKILQQKLEYTFEQLNTPLKLKKEFPEAYNFWMKIFNNNIVETSNINDLRKIMENI